MEDRNLHKNQHESVSLERRILEFIGELRKGGVQVSMGESIDCLHALKQSDWESRRVFKSCMQLTLVKRESDVPIFSKLFDDFFLGIAEGTEIQDLRDHVSGQDILEAGWTLEQVQEALVAALAGGDDDDMAAVARAAVTIIGEMEGGFGSGTGPLGTMAGTGYYLFRILQALDFRQIESELDSMAVEGKILPPLPVALAQEEVAARVEGVRRALEMEVRRRLLQERGYQAVMSKEPKAKRTEEVEFINASLKDVKDMRRLLPGLSRKLAGKLARKRQKGHTGRVDMRNTLRHSISTGGVPFQIKYQKLIPSRPNLFVLCDISGSVRTFSTFTLQLVYSMHQQFSSVRSFVFIDRVDEVTDFFKGCEVDEAVSRVYREADVVEGDGHSDIGKSIGHFTRLVLSDISPRATVLILSDARNNQRNPREWDLAELRDRAKRLIWLNPEPSNRWDTGDSVISVYIPYCHGVYECRNIQQLSEFVARVA